MKTRLRISCLLLAALMLFALAACGKDSPEPSPTPEGTEQTKPPAQPAAESTIHTPLWDLSYDEADGWVYEEDDFYDDEDFSKIILVIPDEADGSEVINAEIRVSVEWLSDLEMLKGLEPLAKDDEFVKKFAAVKKANKVDFAAYAKREYGFELDPNTMFNTMVKRLHEYKRQSLKILSVISTYADIKSGKVKAEDVTPRTVFFGAKAAPGYYLAKMTIQLINNVSRVVNNDPDVKGKLAVYFPWNYNVRLAQHLIPATDLDEQISQAGKEASGTGNMKFALNGAMTVGTLDGANVEIRERVGAENFFLFGMTVDEVEKKYAEGYNPASYYEADPRLKHAIDMVADGTFSNGDRNAYSPLVADWLTKDWFMTLADFSAYMDIQSEIEALYADELEWNRKALLNVANSGYFSSDRSMEDYLERIWHTAPLA